MKGNYYRVLLACLSVYFSCCCWFFFLLFSCCFAIYRSKSLKSIRNALARSNLSLLSLPRVAFLPLTYDDIRYGAVNERTNSAQFFVFFFFLFVLLHSATKIYFGPVAIVFFLSLSLCVCVFRVAAACTCQTRRRASRI